MVMKTAKANFFRCMALVGALCYMMPFHAQKPAKWYWGGGVSVGAGKTWFDRGNTMANVRFKVHPYFTGALFLTGRYDFNSRWALMGSLEFRSVGFEYSFTESEYSLLHSTGQQNIRHSHTILTTPLMGMYKTLPDCKNKRWVFGLGIVPVFSGEENVKSTLDVEISTRGQIIYTAESHFQRAFLSYGRWMVGREKLYRGGNILQWGMECTFLPQTIARSTINYTVDGNSYTHTFTNKGNYMGIFVRWLFGS